MGKIVLAIFFVATLHAQDIAGDWQGTLKTGKADLRIIVNFTKSADDVWKSMLYSIDQGADGIAANSVTLAGADLKFAVDSIHGSYDGAISADGASIEGTWTQGKPLPLELKRATKETAWQKDPSPHTLQFITVDHNVKLEVLDWGGSGRPLVLLTGLGNNAHVFDKFAPKLIASYHVYGITRRGFGASDSPAPVDTNYMADRLADDVLEVIDFLKLKRPVLAGHSIAGEELSSIGSRYPEKVAGLIYLDAGYPYAYYDRSRGNFLLDSLDLQRKLKQLIQLTPGNAAQDQKQLVDELLQTSLPQFEKDLQERKKELADAPAPQPPRPSESKGPTPSQAIMAGQQKYTDIHCPVLAIYALPHAGVPGVANDPEARAKAEARDMATTGVQAKAFEAGVPGAHVVRLAHANHYVFQSNEADVLREMNAFVASLP